MDTLVIHLHSWKDEHQVKLSGTLYISSEVPTETSAPPAMTKRFVPHRGISSSSLLPQAESAVDPTFITTVRSGAQSSCEEGTTAVPTAIRSFGRRSLFQSMDTVSVVICIFISFVVIFSGIPLGRRLAEDLKQALRIYPTETSCFLVAAVFLLGVFIVIQVMRKVFRNHLLAAPGTIVGDWLTMHWFKYMLGSSLRNSSSKGTALSRSLLGCDEWWARFDGLDQSDQTHIENRTNEVLSELKCDYNYEGLRRFDPFVTQTIERMLGEGEGASWNAERNEEQALMYGNTHEEREMAVIDAHSRETGAFSFGTAEADGRGKSLRREIRTIVITGLLGYHSTRRDMREWYQQEWQFVDGCGTGKGSHASGPHGKSVYQSREGKVTRYYKLSHLVILQSFFRSERGLKNYGAGKNADEYDAWLAGLKRGKNFFRGGTRSGDGNGEADGSGVRSWGSWVRLMEQVRAECEEQTHHFNHVVAHRV